MMIKYRIRRKRIKPKGQKRLPKRRRSRQTLPSRKRMPVRNPRTLWYSTAFVVAQRHILSGIVTRRGI